MRDVNWSRAGGIAAALMSLTLLVGSAHAAKKLNSVKRGHPTSSQKFSPRKHPESKRSKPAEQRPPIPNVPASSSSASRTIPASPMPSRGPARIDFDDRLIQGQTNKSGAVYLYDRKELKIRSMIKQRESFRDDIIATVYDN